jgi:hypothetical protein
MNIRYARGRPPMSIIIMYPPNWKTVVDTENLDKAKEIARRRLNKGLTSGKMVSKKGFDENYGWSVKWRNKLGKVV